MLSWNYRIIKTLSQGQPIYRIHEVYYGRGGKIEGWTAEPVRPSGEDVAKLREDIFHFFQAFRQPVLELREKDGKQELVETEEHYELNRGHYFEFLDRAFVAMQYVHQFLGCHPILRREKKLRKMYEKIEKLMADIYEEAGRLDFEVEEKKD